MSAFVYPFHVQTSAITRSTRAASFIYPFHGRETTAFADSLEVADLVGVRHEGVSARINAIKADLAPDDRADWFWEARIEICPHPDVDTVVDVIEMTFEGFAVLMMGFTGAAAARFRTRYVQQFRHLAIEDSRRYADLPVKEGYHRPVDQVVLASMYEWLAGFCGENQATDSSRPSTADSDTAPD